MIGNDPYCHFPFCECSPLQCQYDGQEPSFDNYEDMYDWIARRQAVRSLYREHIWSRRAKAAGAFCGKWLVWGGLAAMVAYGHLPRAW